MFPFRSIIARRAWAFAWRAPTFAWRAVAFAAPLALLPACGPPGSGPAPSTAIAKLDGGKVRLSEMVGRDAVILVFWDTGCDACMQQMPLFVDLDRKYRDRGLRVLTVSIDGPETRSQVGAMAQVRGIIALPILLDDSSVLVNRYNPRVELPFTLFIGRSGKVTKRVAGLYMTGKAEGLAPLVEQMLAEAPMVADPPGVSTVPAP